MEELWWDACRLTIASLLLLFPLLAVSPSTLVTRPTRKTTDNERYRKTIRPELTTINFVFNETRARYVRGSEAIDVFYFGARATQIVRAVLIRARRVYPGFSFPFISSFRACFNFRRDHCVSSRRIRRATSNERRFKTLLREQIRSEPTETLQTREIIKAIRLICILNSVHRGEL